MNEIKKSHSKFDVFEVKLASHREYNISVEAAGDLSLHTVLADGLRTLNAVPLNCFVLGGCQHYPAHVAEWGAPISPLTWIHGDACESGEISSTQVTALSGIPVTPVMFGGRIVGTCYKDDYARYVRLGGLLPSDSSASRDMGWGDVSRGIAYFKNCNDVDIFKTCCMKKGIERFPLSISHADVCRVDLLFELEVDAITLEKK